MLVTAASVITSCTLMGTIASASLRKIAARSVYRLAYKSLGQTFGSVLHVARHNEAVTFALGKLLDEAKDDVTKRVKDAVKDYLQAAASPDSVTPLARSLDIRAAILRSSLMAFAAADAIESSTAGETAKKAAFDSLRRAPIAQHPSVRPTDLPGTLAEKIELTFYMAAVLDSDELVDVPYESTMGMAGTGMLMNRSTSRPIAQLPSDRDYPRPPFPRPVFGGVPAHQYIAISRAGSKVQERTNELTRTIFNNKPFYERGSFFGVFGPDDTAKPAELIAAERLLDRLADAARPRTLTDARI